MLHLFKLPLILGLCLGSVLGVAAGSELHDVQQDPHQSATVSIDQETQARLDAVFHEKSLHKGVTSAQMVSMISGKFLGIPYQANKLHGSITEQEKLVVDFRGLDCFTYVDYVEALQRSSSQQDFVKNIILTRYVDGNVGFLQRKHFFTDWVTKNYKVATDVTRTISVDAVTVEKHLNKKADGGSYIPGLPVVDRKVTYVPGKSVNQAVVSRLRVGDVIGIYTPRAGLDVTHTGLFIMTDNGPVLRHASLRIGKVVDVPFLAYVSQKPGMMVFRVND
jgi:hypothetical protein